MLKRRKVAAAILLTLQNEAETKKKEKKKAFWSKEWYLRRDESNHLNLLREINKSHPEDYKNYLRMDENTFYTLLEIVGKRIKKQNTVMREAISPEDRLAATLRYLATGNSFEDLKYATSISPKTLRVIIPETCKVIYEELQKDYISVSLYRVASS